MKMNDSDKWITAIEVLNSLRYTQDAFTRLETLMKFQHSYELKLLLTYYLSPFYRTKEKVKITPKIKQRITTPLPISYFNNLLELKIKLSCYDSTTKLKTPKILLGMFANLPYSVQVFTDRYLHDQLPLQDLPYQTLKRLFGGIKTDFNLQVPKQITVNDLKDLHYPLVAYVDTSATKFITVNHGNKQLGFWGLEGQKLEGSILKNFFGIMSRFHQHSKYVALCELVPDYNPKHPICKANRGWLAEYSRYLLEDKSTESTNAIINILDIFDYDFFMAETGSLKTFYGRQEHLLATFRSELGNSKARIKSKTNIVLNHFEQAKAYYEEVCQTQHKGIVLNSLDKSYVFGYTDYSYYLNLGGTNALPSS